MITQEARQDVESGPIPLLNRYKHGLVRRRLLQTATGGLRLYRVPWFVHLGQALLYATPLLTALPFIVLDAIRVWSPHYLALVYGCLLGLFTLALTTAGLCIKRHKTPSAGERRVESRMDTEEEKEGDISEVTTCFSLTTFQFIFAARKLHSVIIHPLTSGLLSFAGCFMLLPCVAGEALPVGGVVVVSVFGWATLSNALYSQIVSPPPEPAVYRPTDPLELRFFMRPFYVLTLAAAFFTIRSLLSEPTLCLQLVYAALCLLPLAWLLGILPPLDALVPWAMEQLFTRVLGGSAMASDFRLLVAFSLSLIMTAIVAVITNRSIAVVVATVFGFLLSQDLFSHLKFLSYLLTLKCSRTRCGNVLSKTYVSYFLLGDFRPITTVRLYGRCLAAGALRGVTVLLLSSVLVYFTFELNSDAEKIARIVLAITLAVGYLLRVLADNLQRMYVFGVFRNPLYPWDCQNLGKFHKKRALLGRASLLRKLMSGYAYPLLLVACAGLSLETRHTDIPHIWFGISAARVLRKIWQNTSAAYLELLMVYILQLALPNDGQWAVLGLGTQALIIGVALDVASDFLGKIWFACTLLIAFVGDKKQRSYLPVNIGLLTGSFLLFPFIVIVIFITSLLSSPLLPLFTLPFFLPSFPRTRRFWPSLVSFGSSYSKCKDSVYYQQVESEFARALSSALSTGRLSVCPGSHLLLRFQDRLSVATVLEAGYGYVTVTLRGLELQETSCHAIEATRVDDIFESAYGRESQSCLGFWFNTHFLNTLQPVDSVVIRTYSDAHNVLSGIIDQPSTLERFSGNLLKCIVWVLYGHLCDLKRNNLGSPFESTDSGLPNSHSIRVSAQTANAAPYNQTTDLKLSSTHQLPSSPPLSPSSWNSSISTLGDADTPLNQNRHTSQLQFSPMLPSDPGVEPTTSLPGLIPEDRPLELEVTETMISRTTIDKGTATSEVMISLNGPTSANMQRVATNHCYTDAVAAVIKTSNWRELPLRYSEISKLLRNFPQEWFQFIKDTTETSLGHQETEQDFLKLIAVCFSLVDIPCSRKAGGGTSARQDRTMPMDIYRGFCGEFPYSVHLDWLKSDNTLNTLILKAYRYAVRLLYDESSLGEVGSPAELVEYLQDYDSNYFIGSESETGWEEGIRKGKPNLFSLGRDPEKDLYTAHALSLQDEIVHIGRLNPEAVRAVWADLSLELLYLTNDDEERYSIQAHPLLLRNLTIQAADPPMGYSVYSSGIVRIPNL